MHNTHNNSFTFTAVYLSILSRPAPLHKIKSLLERFIQKNNYICRCKKYKLKLQEGTVKVGNGKLSLNKSIIANLSNAEQSKIVCNLQPIIRLFK